MRRPALAHISAASRRLGTLLASTLGQAVLVMVSPALAAADHASIQAVDAGNGSLKVTYAVSSTSGTPGQVLFPGGPVFGRNYAWYAYLAEEHPARACSPPWANYLRHVESIHEDPGTVTRTVVVRPFFPRQIKLCVFINNPAGERVVGERIVDLPAGYGVQRSSGYNCSAFSRYSAQDYLWLYPDDPSGLDADDDGAACEHLEGPAAGPQLPAEPPPPPPPPHASCTDGVDSDGDGLTDLADLDWQSIDTRCDMIRATPYIFPAPTPTPTDDPASIPERWKSPPPRRPVRLICNKFVGPNGDNVAYRAKAPKRCSIWRTDWAHAEALPFINARWANWGTPTARARITITGNSGARYKARIKAYRLRTDCTGEARIYTRVALLPAGKHKRTIVYQPDTCPG